MFFIIDIKRQLAQRLAQASMFVLVLIHNHSARQKTQIERVYRRVLTIEQQSKGCIRRRRHQWI